MTAIASEGRASRDGLSATISGRRWLWMVPIAVAVLVFGGLLIVGIVRMWDPLPFWDMWDGYLGFWYSLNGGDVSAWWAQHNEHRIILARLFFWIDLAVFRGAGWSLIVANLAAGIGICATFLAILVARLRESLGGVGRSSTLACLGILVAAFSLSWLAQENWLWGFQIQYLLSVLLPLIAFGVLAAAAADTPHATARYVGGVAVAAASVWTIASGLAAPFVAVALAVSLGMSRRRVAALAIVAVASAALYLHGYTAPPDEANPLQSLHDPLTVAAYVVRYLGAPAELISGDSQLGLASAVALLAILAASAFRFVIGRDRTRFAAALLAFELFIMLGALTTALGRVNFGVGQALASRYETPVLAAWSGALVLMAPLVQRLRRPVWWGGGVAVMALVAAAFLFAQFRALNSPAQLLFRRQQATLAIALGIPDLASVKYTFPTATLPVELGARAMNDGLTILAEPPWSDLRAGLGAPQPTQPATTCGTDGVTATEIAGSGFARLQGKASGISNLGPRQSVLAVVGVGGRIVGYAVAQSFGGSGAGAPFVAYVQDAAVKSPLQLAGPVAMCSSTFEAR